MNAKELRISNLIKLTATGEISTVTGIMQDSHGVKVFGITPDKTYCNPWIEHCEPITLTPEWLERIGFVADHENKILGTYFDHGDYGVYMMGNIICDYFYTDTRLKYLHQLQNLYFALTGSELEINY